jgi:2-polyprenyl-3-methyl-5-hydroxy-6-metoxy-1,4-benzoquinol methylase
MTAEHLGDQLRTEFSRQGMQPKAASLEVSPLENSLREIAQRYPKELVAGQLRDIPRIAFNIGLIVDRVGEEVSVCDLGGGIGLFSVGCAARGMKSTLIDDFNDSVNARFATVPNTLHRQLSVNVISADLVASPPDMPRNSLDVVTSFDSIEHWHSSPKPSLHRALSWLKPGGLLILGVPNCVNLRKRLTVPLGRGKWSSMSDWYEESSFRGHVREPDVDDLHYIARDLELQNVEIIGRNWLGYHHRSALVRSVTRLVDLPLRMFPSLCADIYLIGTKGKAG